MGHTVSGSDLREQPVLDRVRAAGVAVSVGHDAGAVDGCDAVTASTAIPERNIELRARPRARHPDAAAGGDAGVDLRPGPLRRRGRHARQDDDDVDAHADARRGRVVAELRRRRRRRRRRHRGPLDRRRVARRRGRRERRHPRRAAAARHHPHQRRARLPRALRHVRRSARQLRPLPRRRSPGRRCCAPTTSSAPPWPRATRRRRTAWPRTADVRAVEVRSGGGSFSFDDRAARPAPRRGPPAVARAAQRRQRHRRHRHGPLPRRPVRGVRGRARPLRRGRPAVRHPRGRRRGHVRRRLRPPAVGDRRRHRRGPRQRRRLGSGGRRLPAQPLQPHRRDVAATTPMPSSAPTSSCSPRSTRRVPRRSPG